MAQLRQEGELRAESSQRLTIRRHIAQDLQRRGAIGMCCVTDAVYGAHTALAEPAFDLLAPIDDGAIGDDVGRTTARGSRRGARRSSRCFAGGTRRRLLVTDGPGRNVLV